MATAKLVSALWRRLRRLRQSNQIIATVFCSVITEVIEKHHDIEQSGASLFLAVFLCSTEKQQMPQE